ncbi:MAG: low temperature requirement protein A [Actinomycetota bacterium]|nr:low temperature requirement protein A [Actinomycetota bacterium]
MPTWTCPGTCRAGAELLPDRVASYFHYGTPAAQHSLETDASQGRIVRDVFSYLHFLLIVGIICVAVGLKKLLAHPLDEPHKAGRVAARTGRGGLPARLLLRPLADVRRRQRDGGLAGHDQPRVLHLPRRGT